MNSAYAKTQRVCFHRSTANLITALSAC